jgi:hypothetical protein
MLYPNSPKADYKIGTSNDGNKESHKQRQRIKQDVMGRTRRLLSFDTTRTAQKTTRLTVLLLLRVYSLPR